MNRRRIIAKVILWAALGAWLALTVERFLLSLGTPSQLEGTAPPWGKAAALIGLGCAAVLASLFFLEKRRRTPVDGIPFAGPLASGKTRPFDPLTIRLLSPDSLAAPRRYSFAAMAAAALIVAVFPQDALLGKTAKRTPVLAPRTVAGYAVNRAGTTDYDLRIHPPDEPIPSGASRVRLMIIDGNRNGRLVPFPHDDHLDYLLDEDACGSCHHQNMPFDQHTSCVECHRDMFEETDIFSHPSHIERLGGNAACITCHKDPAAVKGRDTATACTTCHRDMVVEDAFIEAAEGGLQGYAASYQEAMHGLCIGCHFESEEADCAFCHRDSLSSQLYTQGPYANSRP